MCLLYSCAVPRACARACVCVCVRICMSASTWRWHVFTCANAQIHNCATPHALVAGYYCPTPAAKLVCPALFYCPAGSHDPQPCGALSVCNEGQAAPSNLVSIVVLLFLALVMGVGVWVRFVVGCVSLLPLAPGFRET